jgi:hypothetical protein
MVFVVQWVSTRAGDPPVRMSKARKEEALDAAVGLLGQGMKNISIIDDKGRSYTPREFVDHLDEIV